MKQAHRFTEGEDIWVFGYGSLMWRPGFPYIEKTEARLYGYHRRFCVYSHVYRGSPEAPGLVLGLDRGGSCRGMAFRVAAGDAAQTLDYLDDRELIYSVYKPVRVSLRTPERAPLKAHTYVVKPGDRQHAMGLSDDELIDLLVSRQGQSGTNLDYLRNTVGHLRDFEIYDRSLEALLQVAEARATRG